MVFEEKNMLITSRASSAIYLVLDSLKDKGNVIVPANLCYAGIYPILYAGMAPVFCDVDQHSGNTNLDFFKKAVTSETVAAIIPHMYGLVPRSIATGHNERKGKISPCFFTGRRKKP